MARSTRSLLRGPGPILALLFLLLVLIGVLQAGMSTPRPPYGLDDRSDTGLLLLRRWLEAQGYRVATNQGPAFHIPAETQVLFIYPGRRHFQPDETRALDAWIRAGGTAVIVAVDDPELSHTLRYNTYAGPSGDLDHLALPLLPLGPAQPRLGAPDDFALAVDSEAPGALKVVIDGEVQPDGVATVTLVPWGAGRVWLLAEGYAFTNRHLALPGQAELVLAILARVPRGSVVAFDTFHQQRPAAGEKAGDGSLRDWLFGTPTGWALLFAAGWMALVWALQGRRLGPPIPAAGEGPRREAAEYVKAMANLYRQAHARAPVADHLRRRLKRALGRPWGLSPDLPDAEFLARLRQLAPERPPEYWARLQDLLAELAAYPDDARLTELARAIDNLLAEE